jgi:AMP nucleosidase
VGAEWTNPGYPPRLGKFQAPGVYASAITQPGFFRPYLLEQLRPLAGESGASLQVHTSNQKISHPYVLDRGDHSDASPADLARHFLPLAVSDRRLGGGWAVDIWGGAGPALELFDAGHVDYSLRRLLHYTGTDWRS